MYKDYIIRTGQFIDIINLKFIKECHTFDGDKGDIHRKI